MGINYKKNLRGQKGITLIALVITIIVLLILAGVTIATLTGENGILMQASKAKEQTEIAQELEEVQLAVINSSLNDDVKFNKEDFENELEQYGASIIRELNQCYYVKFIQSKRYYKIDSKNQVYHLSEGILYTDNLIVEYRSNEIMKKQLNVQLLDLFGEIEYFSENTNIIQIDSEGTISVKGKGNTTILASCEGYIEKFKISAIEIGDYVDYNVDYINLNTNQKNDALKTDYNGWRVLNINEQQIDIVSAGVPLRYYHGSDAISTVTELTTNFLHANFEENGFEDTLSEVFSNSITENVRSLTLEDINLANKKIKNIQTDVTHGTLVNESDLFAIPCDVEGQFTCYWLATRGMGWSSKYIWTYESNGRLYGNNWYGGSSLGVRVVVSLKNDIKFIKSNNSLEEIYKWEIEF